LRQRTAERYSETIARVRRGVLDSVKEQLVSDVPIGLFLSSGLDSSVLLAAMTAETGTVRSFTIGFEGDRIAPEWADSTVTANRFGARHETSIVTGLDIAERFDEFVIGLDQPSIDGLNSFWVSLLARQSVTVALSGLGGDESFGGYGWAIELIGLEAHATRSTMISNIRSLLGLRAANIAATVIHPHGLSVVDRYIGLRQMSSATRAASLRVDHSRSENGRQLNDDLSLYDDPSSHPARRVARLDIKAFMGARVLRDIDSVGMAHALEVRFPFLDHRLLSEAFEMPVDHKIDAGRGPGPVSYGAGGLKRVLYDAFAGEIGEEIRRRPKLGFDMPYDQWLRSDLLPRVEWALLEAPSGRFDRALLSRVLDEWRAGRIAWKLPWLILVFETWFQHVVRRRELPKIPVFGRPRIAAASPVMPH